MVFHPPGRPHGPLLVGARRFAEGCTHNTALGDQWTNMRYLVNTEFKLTQVKSGESPVLKFSQEIPRTYRLCQVKFSLCRICHHEDLHQQRYVLHLSVETQNILKYPWTPVKEELPGAQRERVTERENISCKGILCKN